MKRAKNLLSEIQKKLPIGTDFSNDDSKNTEYNNLPVIAEEHNEYMNMVLTTLKAIGVHAKTIYNSVDDPQIMQNLTEPWVLGKLAVMAEQMRSIRDFVMFSAEKEENDSPHADSSDQPISKTEQSEAGKPGLWDNIRKKKEREGKNYKPAKPGDKDRPDPDQWKKLTK